MARKRLEGTQLNSWDEVDRTLAKIGQIDRQINQIKADGNETIDELKAEIKEDISPMIERKKGLEAAMKEFCEANRAEFARVKTKKLAFGNVGFRLSSKIVIKRVGDTLQALKSLELRSCIRLKEELDKDAMKNLDEETLASVGASLRSTNTFGYEVDQSRLEAEQ